MRFSKQWVASLLVLCGVGGTSLVNGADWSQFRGGTRLSHVAEGTPENWQPAENPAWRSELPGAGLSQPIVVDGGIYLTTAVGSGIARPKSMAGGVVDPSTMGRPQIPKEKIKFQLIKLNPQDGSIAWTKTVAEKVPSTGTHASNSYATETPCGGDGRVFAYFGATGDLAAFDATGKELWKKDLGPQQISNQFGSGASPVLYGNRLLVPRFNEKEGKLLCLDAADGKELWSSEAREGTSWATPVVWSNAGKLEVIAAGNGLVVAFDLESGAERWRLGGIDSSFSCSVVADAAGVYFGTSSPMSKGPIYAVKAGHTGDLSLAENTTSSDAVLWSKTKSGAGMPSPIVVDDLLYFFGNTVTCYEKQTGAEVYRKRMPAGQMAAGCPLVVGKTILVVNETGKLFSLPAGRDFVETEGMQVGSADEVFWSTPALANGTLLVRSSEALYAIPGKK